AQLDSLNQITRNLVANRQPDLKSDSAERRQTGLQPPPQKSAEYWSSHHDRRSPEIIWRASPEAFSRYDVSSAQRHLYASNNDIVRHIRLLNSIGLPSWLAYATFLAE